MKLKQRALISVAGIFAVFGLFFLLQNLPVLVVQLSGDERRHEGLHAHEVQEGSHMSAVRKRLNKSNYSSDDVSPEREKLGDIPVKHGWLPGKDEQSPVGNKQTKTEQNVNIYANFTDHEVEKLLHILTHLNDYKFSFAKLKTYKYTSFLRIHRKRSRRKGLGLPVYRNYGGLHLSNWEKFHKGIQQYALYNPDDPAVDGLLRDMTSESIVDIEMKEGGTQLKLIITFSDEGQALFKPMRYPRAQETLPNHFYFVDYERHNAEVAAFHLDRALGFYCVPPTAGRLVNMTYDIKRLSDSKLAKTFFISPGNNVCFHGSCSYYCDTSHAICGHPDMLEGSFASFLPPDRIAPRKTWRNPWKRSYSKHRKAYWEVYDDLCDKVQEKPPYNKGRRLLDLLDLHIFDFMQGNLDRHHYETFVDFGNETFLLHLDNGRAFGKSVYDDYTILAPVIQCCMIRYSTFIKLVKFYLGPDKLSDIVRQSLANDSLTPILTESHLIALDRRVIGILKVIYSCITEGRRYNEVIIDDFY